MKGKRKQLAERKRLRFSEMGKASQRAQAARRMEGAEQRLHAIAEIDAMNLPRKEGDALGTLQWHDFRTGQVRRWTVRIGDRRDRVTLESAAGKRTQSHGWSWVMSHLRGFLAGRKLPQSPPHEGNPPPGARPPTPAES